MTADGVDRESAISVYDCIYTRFEIAAWDCWLTSPAETRHSVTFMLNIYARVVHFCCAPCPKITPTLTYSSFWLGRHTARSLELYSYEPHPVEAVERLFLLGDTSDLDPS